MNRPILILAGLLCLALPAAAEPSAASSGRYQIAPNEDGFVRLDTETGALTHCSRRDGTWHCDVLAEEHSDLSKQIDALADQVRSLAEELGHLAGRLAVVEDAAAAAPRPPAAEEPSARDQTRDMDEALTFAERLMRRFFDMVRELKNDELPQRI